MHSSDQTVAHRDLRDRSFKGQDLSGADFSGSDLRGCDFSGALLAGATFDRSKTGSTLKRIFPLGAIVGLVAGVVFHALTELLAASLGQTIEDRSWNYIAVLYTVLTLTGAATGIWLTGRRIAGGIAAGLTGGLLGFFYGGSAMDNHPNAAIAGAVLGSGLLVAASLVRRSPLMQLSVTTGSALGTYGGAFWMGALAIATLSTGRIGWAIALSLVCLVYLWITVRALGLLVRQLRQFSSTRFWDANLTQAKFDRQLTRSSDLTDAIGLVWQRDS